MLFVTDTNWQKCNVLVFEILWYVMSIKVQFHHQTTGTKKYIDRVYMKWLTAELRSNGQIEYESTLIDIWILSVPKFPGICKL